MKTLLPNNMTHNKATIEFLKAVRKMRMGIIFSILLLSIELCAQEKHALLIGISTYPVVSSGTSKWTDIHGAEDVNLLSGTLKTENFHVEHLLNEKATAENIRKQLTYLEKHAHNGDFVYIHFSGHGQPVEDKDGDEEDRWDEAIVPYDAEMVYRKGVYEGEKHILDDELSKIISSLSKRLGSQGKILIVIDACHAGTSSRAEEHPEDIAPTRGTNMGFSETKFYRPKREEQPNQYRLTNINDGCGIIILEACLPTQRNVEIQIGEQFYGPLSYSVNHCLMQLNFSQAWIDSIRSTMKAVLPAWSKQQMVVETNIQ